MSLTVFAPSITMALWCVLDGTVSEAVVGIYQSCDDALQVVRSVRTVVKLEPCVVH